MNLTLSDQIDPQTKQELQSVMLRQLELLREILSSIHEERLGIETDHISGINELLERRQQLLVSFEEYHQKFTDIISPLTGTHEVNLPFLQHLEQIQKFLGPEDFELLLLIEQLSCITKEMTGETNSLVHMLELKSGTSHLRGLAIKKVAPVTLRTVVGLADDDQLNDG